MTKKVATTKGATTSVSAAAARHKLSEQLTALAFQAQRLGSLDAKYPTLTQDQLDAKAEVNAIKDEIMGDFEELFSAVEGDESAIAGGAA